MTKLRCIAIDDEPFALDILADDISKVPFLDLVGRYSSPLDAREALETDRDAIDLIFLDIQMPTLTGVQFLRTLSQPPMVILTTAFEQYALDGFELAVVDYLLKPIPFERFMKAVHKAYDLFSLRQKGYSGIRVDEPAPALEPSPAPERDYFFIFSEYKEIKLFYEEVLYVEGLKDYVKIYTTQLSASGLNKPFLSRLSLKAMEAKLPEEGFCRVHKSFIVALSKISSFQRTRLFIGKQEIPVGSSYVAEFQRKYGV
ncbi:LytR/AlgR family response regulator transcription factor [Spirosoma aerophilum]